VVAEQGNQAFRFMPHDILSQIQGLIQSTDAVSKSAQWSPPAHMESVAKKQRVMPAPPTDTEILPQGWLTSLPFDD
jgi:hypothetical protein